jgi:hypothetical protein
LPRVLRDDGLGGDLARRERSTTGWAPSCRCDAGEPQPATCLDPFGGSGTTALVADRLGRNGILIDLKNDYVDMQRDRLMSDAPLFVEWGGEPPPPASSEDAISKAEQTPRNDGNRWNRNNGRGF